MSRTITVIGLVLALTFALALGAIRAQPAQVEAVRDFLSSPTSICAEPCFMGIRPGETTPREAVRLLSASDWVGRLFQTEADNVITWAWSGRQPAWIDSTSPGHLVVDTKGGRRFVSVIDLQSTIPVSTLWLAYGVPERGFITMRADQMIHFISFPQIGMDAYAVIPCPASRHEFWGAYAYIFRGVGWRAKDSDNDYPRLWRQSMTC